MEEQETLQKKWKLYIVFYLAQAPLYYLTALSDIGYRKIGKPERLDVLFNIYIAALIIAFLFYGISLIKEREHKFMKAIQKLGKPQEIAWLFLFLSGFAVSVFSLSVEIRISYLVGHLAFGTLLYVLSYPKNIAQA